MKKIILLLISLILSNSSCKRIQGHQKIPIKNSLSKDIVVVIGANIDTIECVSTSNKIRFSFNDIISSQMIKEDLLNIYNEDWESRLKYSKWYVYFFDKDTFYNYPCDTFKKYKWYEKRELTLDYLNQNNWTITYP
jgi:hypothetical protein